MSISLSWDSVPKLIPHGVNCGWMSSVAAFNNNYYVTFRGSADDGDIDQRLFQISTSQSSKGSTWNELKNLGKTTGFNSHVGPSSAIISQPGSDNTIIKRLGLLFHGSTGYAPDSRIYYALMDNSENFYKTPSGATLETIPMGRTLGYPTMVDADGVVYAAFQSPGTAPFVNEQVYYTVALHPRDLVSEPQLQWGYPQPVAGAFSSFYPCISYNPLTKEFYLVFGGSGNDKNLYWTYGTAFTSPENPAIAWKGVKQILTPETSFYGASVVFVPNPSDNTKGNMVMFWASNIDGQTIKYSILDDTSKTWSAPASVPNGPKLESKANATPSICVSEDGSTLFMIFKGTQHGVNSTYTEAQMYYQYATING